MTDTRLFFASLTEGTRIIRFVRIIELVYRLRVRLHDKMVFDIHGELATTKCNPPDTITSEHKAF